MDDADEKTKLLIVRGQVEQLLRDNDLCADVILVGRGRIEVFTHLEASWSHVRLVSVADVGVGLHLRSKAADYGGDQQAQQRDLAHTVGMVSAIAEVQALHGIGWIEAARRFDEETGAEHTPLKPDPKQ